MRAIVHHEFGDPAQVLGVEEVPLPEPGPREVRLRVLLSPIHNHDLWTIRGTYGYKPELPARAGTEAVGIVDALPCLDLDYSEDSRAEVDMNVVMTGEGRFVEEQGTAEGVAFSRGELDQLLDLAESGISRIFALQRELLAEPPAARR